MGAVQKGCHPERSEGSHLGKGDASPRSVRPRAGFSLGLTQTAFFDALGNLQFFISSAKVKYITKKLCKYLQGAQQSAGDDKLI
jgi:hypothetical protein